MKKIVLIISAFLSLSSIATAQQDTTLNNKGKSSLNPMKQDDKKYSDSSSKYYRYGSDNAGKNKKGKSSKSKNKRDKVDSVNPASPVNK